MKRIIALTLSLLLLLSFVACGNNSDSASSTAESSIIENTSSENVSSEGTSSDYVSAESSEMNDSSEESSEVTSNEDVSREDTSDDISEETSEVSEPSDESSSNESDVSTPNDESSSATECSHKSTKVTNKKTATCTEKGYSGDTICKSCGTVVKKGTDTNMIAHDIIIKNKKSATCAEKGYTGDQFCLKCQKVVVEGETIDKLVAHGETKLTNYKAATSTTEGYTGDMVCEICGKTVVKGEVIPKVQTGSTFIDEFGNSVFVPAGENVFDYTLNNAKDKIPNVNHPYVSIDIENPWKPGEFEHCEWDTLTVEKETFRLINEERVKAGVAPLEWCEEAYYFAYTRAREQEKSWGHTRPNGKDFNHIFSEYDVFPGYCGENLYKVNAVPVSYEPYAVKSWVNSSGHYKNMINEKYTRTAIAIYYSETTGYTYFVQLFFA